MIERLSWERDGLNWPNRQASRFVKAAGITWHVQEIPARNRESGRSAAPEKLLLIHGTGSSTHSWAPLIPLLVDHASIVAIDLPGHAFSEPLPPERMSLPGMAGAMRELLSVIGLKPDLVVGHSAGAAILVRMCLDASISPRAIISINGAFVPFTGLGARLLSPLARLLARSTVIPALFARHASDRKAVERLIAGTGSVIPAEMLEHYALLTSCKAHAAAALAMMAAWDLASLERELPKLAHPLVLVVGGNDRTVPPEQVFGIRDVVQNASCVYLRGVGHLMHEERPTEIAALVLDELGTGEGSAGSHSVG